MLESLIWVNSITCKFDFSQETTIETLNFLSNFRERNFRCLQVFAMIFMFYSMFDNRKPFHSMYD